MEDEKKDVLVEESKSQIEETADVDQVASQQEIEVEESVNTEELDTAALAKVEEWLRFNQGNLKYLDAKKVSALKEILGNSTKLDAASLEELQKLHAELEKELEKKFNTQFNEVKKGLVDLREEMFQIPNYDNLPDELQEVALNTFTNCELRLANTRLIDELSEIFDNFKNIIYPDLAKKIYALENPNVLPINLIEVLDSMPPLSFNTEEELDSVLAELRKSAIIKLNKVKSKQ